MREEYNSSPFDSTPRPVAVDYRESPDSDRSVLSKEKPTRVIDRYRKKLSKALFTGTLAGAMVMAPETANVAREAKVSAVRAEVAQTAERPEAKVFTSAHLKAVREFFPDDGGKGYDLEAYKKLISDIEERAPGTDWQLPAEKIVDPEEIQVEPDGKTVILEGQAYSFAKIRAKEGHYYIVAAKPVVEDHFIQEDEVHMADTMLIGGAHDEDGMDKKELLGEAYENARSNVSYAYRYWNEPRGVVLGRSDVE